MKEDAYKRILINNQEKIANYYTRSAKKTDQQKYLEKLLFDNNNINFDKEYQIADLAAGGGTLSLHLKELFVNSKFHLLDYNENAINIAKQINQEENFNFYLGDLRNLPFENNSLDIIFCWQTLLVFDIKQLQIIFNEILRVLKPNGHFYASSLFNFNHDVDIYSKFYDYSLKYDTDYNEEELLNYNTYSIKTMKKILQNKVQSLNIYELHPETSYAINPNKNSGIGTYTIEYQIEHNQKRKLEISGGMIMSWGILELQKMLA